MHEGVELPFAAQRAGIPQFNERVQGRTGAVQVRDTVIVIDDGGALPGKPQVRLPGATPLPQIESEGGPNLVTVVSAGDLMKIVELSHHAPVFESPFGACQVRNAA